MSINKDSQKVPKLRFKGFTDDWEQRKLGEVSDVRDGTHASPKYVNQGHPMVTSKNLTSSGLDMTDVSFLTDEDFNEINKRSKVSIGDILFGMIGTIGNPVIVDRADFAIKNVALIKEKSYNPITNKWLLQYLKSPSFNRFIQKENAGGTQKFIALGLIRDMILKVPGLEEQQRVGTFLRQIDNTITLHQRKLDQLNQLKEALLQQMFPGKGETVPKLRFAGFEGDWEERKLGEISEMYQPQTITQQDLIDSGYPVFGANGYIGYFSKYNHESGQVTISARGEGTGTPSYVNGPVWITGNSMVINVDESGIDKMFLYTNLLSFSLKKYVTGGAQPQLVREVLIKVPIKIPSNEEQKILGSFFKHLNDTITLQQRKLDQLKNMKQVLLQNMFI